MIPWAQMQHQHILLPADDVSCPILSPMDTVGPSKEGVRLGSSVLVPIHRNICPGQH